MIQWKTGIIEKLSGGITQLAKARNVTILNGKGIFHEPNILRLETNKGQQFIEFEKAIIAVGSTPMIPSAFDLGNKRIMTSTEALMVEEIPENLLVVGGGYIGMELGFVYASLGAQVDLIESSERILIGADLDLTKPVVNQAKKQFKNIYCNTKVTKMSTKGKKIEVQIQSEKKEKKEYDKVLLATGRVPNSKDIGLKDINLNQDEKGFIIVDENLKTNVDHIYAIGDVIGGWMLAHKASKEARVAVDNCCGEKSTAKDAIIPAVVFTNPEVAWCGVTENEAKEKKLNIKVLKYPWAASGRALTLGRTDGLTKLIVEKETDRILGVGIVGINAGELIAEGVLATEAGLTAEDIAQTIHAHPTLSETIMESAETLFGTSTHIITKKS